MILFIIFVFYCDLCKMLFIVVGGEGMIFIDFDGKCYFDVCGGVVVLCFGYGYLCVVDVICKQVCVLVYVYMFFFMIDVVEELVVCLIVVVLGDLDYVYFVLGGFEVIEVVFKLVCQYFVEIGQLQC